VRWLHYHIGQLDRTEPRRAERSREGSSTLEIAVVFSMDLVYTPSRTTTVYRYPVPFQYLTLSTLNYLQCLQRTSIS
jgi:hypothetical protein